MGFLARVLLGADNTETDPTSSDFGKIVINDTRIDPYAGLQQPFRMQALAAKQLGETIGIAEMEKEIDVMDAMTRFMQYKLSANITIPFELIQGENVIGQEREPLETMARAMIPLTIQETFDVMSETESVSATLGTALATSVGIGVSQQTDKSKGRRRKRNEKRTRTR